MRSELKEFVGKKIIMSATLGRVSYNETTKSGKLILMKDIRVLHTNISIDHVWLERDGKFISKRYKKGTRIAFVAKVKEYISLDKDYNQVIKCGINSVQYDVEVTNGGMRAMKAIASNYQGAVNSQRFEKNITNTIGWDYNEK